MKKILILFVVVFTLVFFGCKGEKTEQAKEVALDNTKTEQDLGYSISYPVGWNYTRHPNNAVVIKGKENTPAALTSIQIQSYPNKADGGKYEDAADVIVQFKRTSIQGKVEYFAEKDYIYKIKDGTELKGKQIVVHMVDFGIRQKQVALPSVNGKYIYHWSYTTANASYSTFLDIAEAVLNSWEIFSQ
jgi:hypothetical protein